MLTWMWLTFFATWEARWRALLYGVLFMIVAFAIGAWAGPY
jgi:hypothetical protein